MRFLARATLAAAAVALVALLPSSSAAGRPRPSECDLLRAEVSANAGSMRAEGAVYKMVTAGCERPPFHLLPKP